MKLNRFNTTAMEMLTEDQIMNMTGDQVIEMTEQACLHDRQQRVKYLKEAGIQEDSDDDEDLGEFAEVLMRGIDSFTSKRQSKSPLEKPAQKINKLLAFDASEDSDHAEDITLLRHNTQQEGMTAIGSNFSMVDLEN